MSQSIPVSDNLVLVRTCFSDDKQWESLVRDATNPQEPFVAYFHIVNDPFYRGKEAEDVLAAFPDDYPHPAVFLADERALSEAGHPCLIVSTAGEERRSFRALARELASLDCNLSIANMDFEEFEEAAGPDAVFRGFE